MKNVKSYYIVGRLAVLYEQPWHIY